MNTTALTASMISTMSDFGLDQIAEGALLHLDTQDILPGQYVYGDVKDTLHVVALEIDRRRDLAAAQETLRQIDDLLSCAGTGDMDVNWPAVKVDRTRAMGALLDRASGHDWRRLARQGYSAKGVREALHGQAITEGRWRGFEHAPARVAVLVPDTEAVPPF